MTDDPTADLDRMAEPDRCTATARSTGERCKQPAIPGGTVCRFHGGEAPQTKQKAQERLNEMADSVTADVQRRVDDLLEVYDAAEGEEKVAIMREVRQLWTTVLDRSGHGPTEKREVDGDVDVGGELVIDFEKTDT